MAEWGHRLGTGCYATLLALGSVTSALAQEPEPPPDTLADFSLEELANIQITSVSKRAERLSDAPASVFVITADDIRRSGVTSIPEALRLAPNLEVARINASSYAISSRGFNNGIGNKLQVLLDGRILYTPLFSGVFWDTPDVMLEDVERIEVLSGPGTTLWGANAVNGVINIVTRRASDTQGALISASGGDREHNYALRFGGMAGNASYRIYGKFFERDATMRANGTSQQDRWDRGEIGFRADWGTASDGITVQGATYRGDVDGLTADMEISGTNLLGRWNRTLASGGTTQLQAYFDRNDRDNPASIGQRLDVYEVEFQHDIGGLENHMLVWGINHRGASDEIANTPATAFLPAERDLHWTSVFVRDEFALRDDRFKLIGGLRVEHNSYTGTEVMPTLRFTWKPSASQLLWAAASRAVRTPSRFDRDWFRPAQPPFLLAGGPDFRSEVANVYSLGYRAQPSSRLSYSLTVSHHDYDHLRSFERLPSGQFVIGNKMEGDATSVEAWGVVQLTERWRVSAGGAWLDQRLRLKPGSTDPLGPRGAGNDPEHHWIVRSSLDLPGRLELDASVRHVAELPLPHVPAYTAVDARLGWRPNDRFELSLSGQNLFDAEHVEFGGTTVSQIEREFRVGIRWMF